MDNMICGIIAGAIFMAFVIGLAASIATIPFSIIVGSVCLMLLIDIYQSSKAGLADKKTTAEGRKG